MDHSSALTVIAELARKSDLKKLEHSIMSRFERMSGMEVEKYRKGQGGEYTGTRQNEDFFLWGINHEFSDTQMAFQNGLPEVIGGKIVKMVRAALVQSGDPETHWTNVTVKQTWVHNRVPLQRHKGRTTPFQVLLIKRPNVSRARVWGCEAWVVIHRKTKDKIKSRAERDVNLGVSSCKKAWKFLFFESRKVIESRNACFFESCIPIQKKT